MVKSAGVFYDGGCGRGKCRGGEIREDEAENSFKKEGCPGLVDYVMITIKEPFIKNEESTKDVFIFWVNKI